MTCPPDSATGRKRADNYPDWRPYCLVCNTMSRMVEMPYGFYCDPHLQEDPVRIAGQVIVGRFGCGNSINWDLTHYEPLSTNGAESRQVRRARLRKELKR